MRATRLVCCISVAIVTTACSNTPASAPDTRASDVQTVKTLEAEWVKVVQSKDLDKALSYATDDAITLYPGATILHGKPAIKNYLAPMYADSNFALVDYQNMRSEAFKGGDLVFTAGAQSVTVTDPKTQKPVTDKGKYLTVCRSRPTEAGRLSQTPSIRIRGRSKAVCAESPVDPHRKVRAEYVVPTDVIQDRENVF